MVNKHTVNYHHIPLQLISKIHPLMFLWISKGFIRIFLELFPKAVYSTTVAERFQIYSVKISANTSLRQKVESVHFYSCPQAKVSRWFLSFSSRQTEIAHSSRTAVFEYIFSWGEEGVERMGEGVEGRAEDYGAKTITEIN